MFFIQLVNKGGTLYDDFIVDSKDLMIESSQAIDLKFFSKEIKKGKDKKVEFLFAGDRCELKNSAIPGLFLYKPAGQQFKPSEIK